MAGRIVKLEDAPQGDRLIVCGGRTYGKMLNNYSSEAEKAKDAKRVAAERKVFFQVMDHLRPMEIAQGDAPGADALAREWAFDRKVPCARYRALWEEEGCAAGPKRNRRMFTNFGPGGTVAFPGGRGTTDMEDVSLDGGVYLVRIKFQYVFGMNIETFHILPGGAS